MKKFLLIIVAMVAFASCDIEDAYYEPHTNKRGVTEQAITNEIEKITVEGHEYLEFQRVTYGGWSIAVVHSASCPCHDKKEEQ